MKDQRKTFLNLESSDKPFSIEESSFFLFVSLLTDDRNRFRFSCLFAITSFPLVLISLLWKIGFFDTGKNLCYAYWSFFICNSRSLRPFFSACSSSGCDIEITVFECPLLWIRGAKGNLPERINLIGFKCLIVLLKVFSQLFTQNLSILQEKYLKIIFFIFPVFSSKIELILSEKGGPCCRLWGFRCREPLKTLTKEAICVTTGLREESF